MLRCRYNGPRRRNPKSVKNFIQRLRGAGRKKNPFLLFDSQEPAELLTAFRENIRHAFIEGASELSRRRLLQKIVTGFLHTLRLRVRRGSVIEINHSNPSKLFFIFPYSFLLYSVIIHCKSHRKRILK